MNKNRRKPREHIFFEMSTLLSIYIASKLKVALYSQLPENLNDVVLNYQNFWETQKL